MKTLKRILVNIISIPLALLVLLASLLPFKLSRSFWPVVYFMVYKVIGYRKKVVYENLKKAFPEKSNEKMLGIVKAYYRNLSVLMLETVGLITASKSTINKLAYFDIESQETMQKYYSIKKSCIMVSAHYGNWEILGALFNNTCPFYSVAGFRPMTNLVFNYIMLFTRKRFNHKLVPMNKLPRKTMELARGHDPFALCLITDQWPPPGTATRVNFLGVETPFYNGMEKLARKLKLPVVFTSARKEANGNYSCFATEITNDPNSLPQGEITRRYARLLENEIKANPAHWLWSHRRWK